MGKPWRTIRCRSCGSEYGWNGDYLEMPSCPHCGHEMTESKKEELQKNFDEMISKSQKKIVRRKKPTPTKQKGGKKQAKRRKRKK